MKIIKPAEISAKIMTVIDEADRELIIVSPYNNITGWTKLINRIKKAQARGVNITWISRRNNVDLNNSEEIRKNIGITPILIDDLHAKIYMNQATAIFTSMNLNKASDEKSLDLGYITESTKEYQEIQEFYNRHINNSKVVVVSNVIVQKNEISYNPLPDNVPFWVKIVHNHIIKKYSVKVYNFHEDIIEYSDFVTEGHKVHFEAYSQAIKVVIWFPESFPLWKIEEVKVKSEGIRNSKELEVNADQKYLKYYYELYQKKLPDWRLGMLNYFLENVDQIFLSAFHHR